MSERRRSVDELLKAFGEINRRTGFQARKLPVDENGAILLNPKNPNDVEWYENDAAYDEI